MDEDNEDLSSFVAVLKKNANAAVAVNGPDAAKRRIRQQQASSSAGTESEYATLQGGSRGTLSVEALVGGDSRARADVKATLEKTGTSAAKPRASGVVEERVTRRVSYAEKAQDVEKWSGSIGANRSAETLDLRDKSRSVKLSSAAMVSKFTPTTDMEKEITRLLEGSGAKDDRAVAAAEERELETECGLTAEQVRAKQGELAKMRALLFYEQQKHRRVSKIKSKAYHRIRNRQKRRREGEDGEGHLGELDPEAAAEAEEKEAVKRMRERASLKHKNTSKWAKQQLKAGNLDVSARKALGDQLRLGDELRKRADRPARASGDGSSDEDSDSDSDSSADEDNRKALAATEALILGMDQEANEENVGGAGGGPLGRQTKPVAKGKGLAGMKFMTKAAAQQRASARSEAEALLVALAADTEQLSSGEESPEETGPAKADEAAAAPAMLGGTFEVARRSMPKKLAISGSIDVAPTPAARAHMPVPPEPVAESNPWLDPTAGRPSKRRAKENEAADSGLLDTQRAAADALKDTEHKPRLLGGEPGASKAQGLSQAVLVARAFAAPDFAVEFANEQALAEERAKARQEVPESDGWGSWAGLGSAPAAPPPPSGKRKREGDRGDGGSASAAGKGGPAAKAKPLPTAVVSTKRVKGQAKLKVAEVPYPFTSREQYERSLAVPVGKEWNAMRAARGFARPAVITDAGRAIAPIKLPKKTQHQAPLAKRS